MLTHVCGLRRPAVNGYDSEFSGDTSSTAEDYFNQKPHQTQNAPSGGGYYYSDSEPKSRFTGRSSSGRRSRKTSSSGKELVRILLEEKADASRLHAQLERAYGVLRAESQRAVDAERSAVETAERLKGTHRARAAAQSEASRLQAELRMYKMQYAEAQKQLERANEMITQSDQERERSEREVEKMRKGMEKMREREVARRAMEEGRRIGREEAEAVRRRRLQEVAEAANRRARGIEFPINEDGDESVEGGYATEGQAGGRRRRRSLAQPQHPRGAPVAAESYRTQSPLPVPPPESVPVYSNPVPLAMNRVPADIAYRQAAGDAGYDYQNPTTQAYPPSDGLVDSRPYPDHIIIRSPVPSHAESDMSATRSVDNATPRPIQGDPYSRRQGQPQGPPFPYDADAAMASANRIYSHNSTDSPEFPSRPDSRAAARAYGRGHGYGLDGMGAMGDALSQPEEVRSTNFYSRESFLPDADCCYLDHPTPIHHPTHLCRRTCAHLASPGRRRGWASAFGHLVKHNIQSRDSDNTGSTPVALPPAAQLDARVVER